MFDMRVFEFVLCPQISQFHDSVMFDFVLAKVWLKCC